MSVVAKAIELLGHFSSEAPEIGLSQFCRLAGRDKATTYRHLSALESLGFVEQNPLTKAYRIGPAVLPLAELREATVPRREGALDPLRALAQSTGETAHVAVLSGHALHALVACDSAMHSTRAVVDIQQFPLHATASGLCAVAFGPPELMKKATGKLKAYTGHTATTPQAVESLIAATRQVGFSISAGSFEDDIHSLAVPVYDHSGQLAGTVAVACVASRVTPELTDQIRTGLVQASRQITRNWGGKIPDQIEALWQGAVDPTAQRELAR
jgi:DNA-binding IclR family transcriptional regulator